jgi:hypothetical protein
MRPSRYNGPQPDSWWCTDGVDCLVDPNNPNPYQSQSVEAMIDREMALAAQLGVATIRVEFDWPVIEPSQGVYTWTRADYIVNEALKYGIQLQPVLVYTPLWATGPLGGSSNWWEVPPANDQYWTDFVSQVVSRYKNCIHYWEIWNEPDGGSYWYSNTNPGVQDFVTHLLNPGYQTIKSIDPTAKVIIGPYFADTTWYTTVVQDGGGNSFDIAAFHNYTNTALADVQTMQSWLNSEGMGSKPIWIGEYGYNEGTNTVQDTNHQSLMTTVLQGSGYQQAQWYTLRDELPRNCCPVSGTEGKHYGIVEHDDVTLRDGFSTMRRLIAASGGASAASPTPTAAAVKPSPGASATARPTATPAPGSSQPIRYRVLAAKVESSTSRLDLSLRRRSLTLVRASSRVKLTAYVRAGSAEKTVSIREEIRVTLRGRAVFDRRMSGEIKKSRNRTFAFWAFFRPPRPGTYTFTATISRDDVANHKTTTFSATSR